MNITDLWSTYGDLTTWCHMVPGVITVACGVLLAGFCKVVIRFIVLSIVEG